MIGDLHGRLDLLDQMLARIDAQTASGSARLVFVGDMIDRGPESAGVLRRLHDLTRERPDHVICLMGNHERMLLDFLDDPLRHCFRWMRGGGAETLASFGTNPWAAGTGNTGLNWRGLASSLRAAMPEGMENWLRTLPLIWTEGRIAVTHAGTDPARNIDDQDPDTLLWGHSAFSSRMRKDGIWVAHGHTIVKNAHAVDGCIAVDTGAWVHGRLSAAWIAQEGLSFMTVGEDRHAR